MLIRILKLKQKLRMRMRLRLRLKQRLRLSGRMTGRIVVPATVYQVQGQSGQGESVPRWGGS